MNIIPKKSDIECVIERKLLLRVTIKGIMNKPEVIGDNILSLEKAFELVNKLNEKDDVTVLVNYKKDGFITYWNSLSPNTFSSFSLYLEKNY